MAALAPHYSLDRLKTILVVDDEKLVLDFCSAVLTRAGYEVLLAENGYWALEIVKALQKPIHLALLDIRMPKMSGPELLVELLDWVVPRNLEVRFILERQRDCLEHQGMVVGDEELERAHGLPSLESARGGRRAT